MSFRDINAKKGNAYSAVSGRVVLSPTMGSHRVVRNPDLRAQIR